MGATKQAMIENAERERAQCGRCLKAKDSQCDGCGEPACSECDGVYCWECHERMDEIEAE